MEESKKHGCLGHWLFLTKPQEQLWHEHSRFLFRETSMLVAKMTTVGAGEMAQWLGALAGLAKDQGSIPRTHVVTNNDL